MIGRIQLKLCHNFHRICWLQRKWSCMFDFIMGRYEICFKQILRLQRCYLAYDMDMNDVASQQCCFSCIFWQIFVFHLAILLLCGASMPPKFGPNYVFALEGNPGKLPVTSMFKIISPLNIASTTSITIESPHKMDNRSEELIHYDIWVAETEPQPGNMTIKGFTILFLCMQFCILYSPRNILI